MQVSEEEEEEEEERSLIIEGSSSHVDMQSTRQADGTTHFDVHDAVRGHVEEQNVVVLGVDVSAICSPRLCCVSVLHWRHVTQPVNSGQAKAFSVSGPHTRDVYCASYLRSEATSSSCRVFP